MIVLIYPVIAEEPQKTVVETVVEEEIIKKPLLSETVVTSSPPKIDMTVGFRKIYLAAASRYGIPWELLEAIHMIESGKSGDTCRKSSAGAIGPMQFMPGTWKAYSQGNICNVEDSIFAAAKLLAANGAGDGRVYNAIWQYNHADWYVKKVLNMAKELGYSG